MITYECKIRVRYGETDQMGFYIMPVMSTTMTSRVPR